MDSEGVLDSVSSVRSKAHFECYLSRLKKCILLGLLGISLLGTISISQQRPWCFAVRSNEEGEKEESAGGGLRKRRGQKSQVGQDSRPRARFRLAVNAGSS